MTTIVACAVVGPLPIRAGLSPGRDRLPVVLKGANLGSWVGTRQIDQIHLYIYDPTQTPSWVRIRHQIDKRRRVNVIHDIGDPAFVNGLSPTSRASDICVLSYFKPRYCDDWASGSGVRECPQTYGAPFDSPLLAATDEIVFMARDLIGSTRDPACPPSWPGGTGVQAERVEILITDDGDGNGTITEDEKFWVYAYEWTTAPPGPDPYGDPPLYTHAPCGSICSGGNAPNSAFNDHCGTATGPATTSGVEGYQTRFSSNWETVDFGVIDAGSATIRTDIWDGINSRMGGQINPTWSCHNLPRPLGPAGNALQSRPVRFLRGVQGARSGPATRKYEKVYDSCFETEVELRVHFLTDLNWMQGHNQEVANQVPPSPDASAVWFASLTTNGGSPHDSRIDGMPPLPPPPAPPLDDGTEILNDGVFGGTVTYTFPDADRGPLEATRSAGLYMDVSLPYGNFGSEHDDVCSTQDGTIDNVVVNDGGCGANGDPEGSYLLFKRLIRLNIPRTPQSDAHDDANTAVREWKYAALHPIEYGAWHLQSLTESCGGQPPLCTPTVGVNPFGDGGVELTPSITPNTGCDGVADGFGLTRQTGSGAEEIIGYVGSSGTARDMMARPGQAHTYRAFALASDGRVSAKSAPVTATPANSAPPPPPVIKSVTAIDSGAVVESEGGMSGDALFMNFFVAQSSGGPYSQVNSQPIYLDSVSQFTVSGLQNGTTYYVVATLVDTAGNQSGYSPEFSVVPGP